MGYLQYSGGEKKLQRGAAVWDSGRFLIYYIMLYRSNFVQNNNNIFPPKVLYYILGELSLFFGTARRPTPAARRTREKENKMFQVGDMVCYGTTGACQITSHEARRYGDNVQNCFVLKPVFDKSMTICVPDGNPVLMGRMHPVMTRDEILALIRELPNEKVECDTNPDARKQYYNETLKNGDHRELLRMVKSIYNFKKKRHAMGKRLSGFDENAMREAENMLYTEFALVLDIQPKEVVPFIRRELGGEEA